MDNTTSISRIRRRVRQLPRPGTGLFGLVVFLLLLLLTTGQDTQEHQQGHHVHQQQEDDPHHHHAPEEHHHHHHGDLHQEQDAHHHAHVHVHAEHKHHHGETKTTTATWMHLLPRLESPWAKAFASTAVISIIPTMIIPLIPVTRDANGGVSINESLQKLLLSFAAGGLLGEVWLHSLPHLLEKHDHFSHDHGGEGNHPHDHHHHDHHPVELKEGDVMRVSLWILTGFLLFFIAEKLVRVMLGEDGTHSHSHSHSHSHVHAHVDPSKNVEEDDIAAEEDDNDDDSLDSRGLRRRSRRIEEKMSPHERTARKAANRSSSSSSSSGSRKKHSILGKSSNGNKEAHQTGFFSGLKASGFLNIALDLAHNVTDGLAIGVSFSSGHGIGMATTLSVMMHEVPHEIGDFAMLVQSGFTIRKAFLMQFVTAGAAFVGTFVGLVSSKRNEGIEQALLGLTTGGFLYVAAVNVLPELLVGKATLKQSLCEIAGVLGGIGLMAYVAMGEGH